MCNTRVGGRGSVRLDSDCLSSSSSERSLRVCNTRGGGRRLCPVGRQVSESRCCEARCAEDLLLRSCWSIRVACWCCWGMLHLIFKAYPNSRVPVGLGLVGCARSWLRCLEDVCYSLLASRERYAVPPWGRHQPANDRCWNWRLKLLLPLRVFRP